MTDLRGQNKIKEKMKKIGISLRINILSKVKKVKWSLVLNVVVLTVLEGILWTKSSILTDRLAEEDKISEALLISTIVGIVIGVANWLMLNKIRKEWKK